MANPPEIQKNLKYHGFFFCGKIIVKTKLPSSSQPWRAGTAPIEFDDFARCSQRTKAPQKKGGFPIAMFNYQRVSIINHY